MNHHATRVAEFVFIFGASSGTAYYLLCLWSAKGFLRARTALHSIPPGVDLTQATPPVSILKPLKGTDPEIYESFRSHCLQDYPEYEILFGVSEPDDPGIALVEKLQQEFPCLSIRWVLCPNILGANVKVSNLAQMLPLAKYNHLIVNDSDIRVPPNYLRPAIAPLADPKVGMVTCLYRGVAQATLGSHLESIGIATDFSGGVLVAQELEGGVRFGLGSTLAFRRQDLAAIGGFETLVDYLADDYELGARIAARGLRVQLADVVVETFLPAYSLTGFLQHQLRWARSVRDSRRWGYFGLVLTFGIAWALLALVVAHGAVWAWVMFALTLAVRLAMAVMVGREVLQDQQVVRFLWLIPLRDMVALLVWIASYAGHRVHWRGDYFQLKDGKLARINL